jgi:hypothetical protein
MNDKLWTIELNGNEHGKTEQVTCEVCGVAQDGSLIAFNIENGQPTAIKGYAPGVWCKFSRSQLRVN